MSLYRTFVPQASQMLLNLRNWLERAEAHGKEIGYDPDVLLTARLFPNQYPLAAQVRIACDTAKLTAARVTGKEAPKHADTEASTAELKERIAATRQYLETIVPADFDGAESRLVVLPFAPQRASTADDYVREFALPNLYFHVTTAYALLRHNGVPLGKQDYIGRLTTQPAP